MKGFWRFFESSCPGGICSFGLHSAAVEGVMVGGRFIIKEAMPD